MLPSFLIECLKKDYSSYEEILEGYKEKRWTTLRVNTLKSTVLEIEALFDKLQIDYEKSNFSPLAFIIKNKPISYLKELDAYKQGKIYLQSLSSQLPPILLDPKEEMDILDMAAAPGGKTAQIASITRNKAHILACEKNKIRFDKLNYNLTLQGAKVNIMQIDSLKLDNYFQFDAILLDAPCSGTGTIQWNDEKSYQHISKKFIENINQLQLELLLKALSMLKKGKTMIYSTCSILKAENEDILLKAQKRTPFEIVSLSVPNLPLLETKLSGVLCVKPTAYYEGFFIAKLKKI